MPIFIIQLRLFDYRKLLGVVICMHALSLTALGGEYDGLKPLSGTTGKVIEINRHKIIDGVDPDTVGLPKKFLIDFKSRTLRPSKESLVRKTIAFSHIVHMEDNLVMQGVDDGVEGVNDGLAWSLTISKKNGKAVLAASGDGVAYVVFGVCTPIGGKP